MLACAGAFDLRAFPPPGCCCGLDLSRAAGRLDAGAGSSGVHTGAVVAGVATRVSSTTTVSWLCGGGTGADPDTLALLALYSASYLALVSADASRHFSPSRLKISALDTSGLSFLMLARSACEKRMKAEPPRFWAVGGVVARVLLDLAEPAFSLDDDATEPPVVGADVARYARISASALALLALYSASYLALVSADASRHFSPSRL